VAHAHSADERAVERAGVDHAPATRAQANLAMEPRNARVVEDALVRRVRPDAKDISFEDHAAIGRLARLLFDSDLELGDDGGARARRLGLAGTSGLGRGRISVLRSGALRHRP